MILLSFGEGEGAMEKLSTVGSKLGVAPSDPCLASCRIQHGMTLLVGLLSSGRFGKFLLYN